MATIYETLVNAAKVFMARRSKEQRYMEKDRVPYIPRTVSSSYITPDTAIQIPAVWACLRYLSQTVAVLPWRVMRETEKGGEKVTTNPVDYILNKRASPEWSAFQFRETMTHWALRYGNGYAEIEFDSRGRPYNLWPLPPWRVEVCRDANTGYLYYELDGNMRFEPREIFHVRGFGEGPVGVNVITYAAQSLGWAAAAQLFGASFFGNSLNVAGIVKVKKELSIPAKEQLERDMARLYRGVHNSNKTAILDQDMEWEQISVDPNKAQFISTNQHLIEEVCRWFGVPPHKIMHMLRSTFSNIEHQSIEVVVDSISPWVKRFEEEADFKLFGGNRGNLYTKMNLNALMRGDSSSRGNWYQMMRNVGAFSVNDILRLEDQNTIPEEEGGDKRVMQMGFTTLEKIGEDPPAPPAPALPSPSKELPAKEERTDEDIDALESMKALLGAESLVNG